MMLALPCELVIIFVEEQYDFCDRNIIHFRVGNEYLYVYLYSYTRDPLHRACRTRIYLHNVLSENHVANFSPNWTTTELTCSAFSIRKVPLRKIYFIQKIFLESTRNHEMYDSQLNVTTQSIFMSPSQIGFILTSIIKLTRTMSDIPRLHSEIMNLPLHRDLIWSLWHHLNDAGLTLDSRKDYFVIDSYPEIRRKTLCIHFEKLNFNSC